MRRSDRQRAYRAKMLRKAKHNPTRLQWLYAWEEVRTGRIITYQPPMRHIARQVLAARDTFVWLELPLLTRKRLRSLDKVQRAIELYR